MTRSSNTIHLGISIGDINGIGPEVIMKALDDARILEDCTPVIYGSSKILAFHRKNVDTKEFNYQTIKSADEAQEGKINVINVWTKDPEFKLGEPTIESGQCAFDSLERATTDLASGKIDVLVTAPISKEAMGKTDFRFPGHTEYLADLAGQEDALMLMVANNLRVGLVTTHVALSEVSKLLTTERIIKKINDVNSSLIKDFGIRRPKIAVLGLNPHAGENGKMGSEESEVIIPAINSVKNKGILAFGPFPADGFFGSKAIKDFDGVLAMYHDQGLTAFKALAFDEGVNYTAGLPVVRTSPDHGTAYSIAGKDEASGTSMRNAIYLAMDVYRNRQFEKEINANPLQQLSLKEGNEKGDKKEY